MAQILIQPINEICRSCTTLDFSLETQRASIVNRTTPIQFITCSGSWIVINPCHQNSLGWSYQCTKRCQIWEHCFEKGPYKDLWDFLGPYLFFRIPMFCVLAQIRQRISIRSTCIHRSPSRRVKIYNVTMDKTEMAKGLPKLYRYQISFWILSY